MKLLWLAALLLSSWAMAQEGCHPLPAFTEFNDLSALTDLEPGSTFLRRPVIADSPCKSPEPTQEEMLTYLRSLATGNVRTRTVAGARLRDDQAMLDLYGEIHNRDPRSASEPWRYARGASLVIPENCRDVICAMQATYGEEHGIQLLYMRAKFGMNSSHLASGEQNSIAWQPRDFAKVLSMLEDMPDHMLPINEGMRMVLFSSNGPTPTNRAVAVSWIHVYNPWHNLPESEKTTSLAHELGHVFGESHAYTPAWLALSGWREELLPEKHWVMGRPETAVLQYARTNPDEDFGESFFMYRYNGAAMKRRFPEKYHYMRERVFGGAEFNSHTSCTYR
jgi:hypothetical protein